MVNNNLKSEAPTCGGHEGLPPAPLLGDSEKIIMHLTENHVGFDETTLHIARQWMRATWAMAMQQSYGDTWRLDWMENNYQGVETYPMDDPDGEPTRRLWIPENMGAQMARPTIREAIDAAMSPNAKLCGLRD